MKARAIWIMRWIVEPRWTFADIAAFGLTLRAFQDGKAPVGTFFIILLAVGIAGSHLRDRLKGIQP